MVKDVKSITGAFLSRHNQKARPSEFEVKTFLRNIGLPLPRNVLVSNKLIPDHDLKYPLVAKVSSATIVSKSDVGGVRTNIKNENELSSVIKELLGISGAEGLLIEEMAPPGIEVIVGGLIDEQFGPVVMFGIGGIFVELYHDVVFGLAPITEGDALQLIRGIKGYKSLEGYRGQKPADMQSLTKIIVSTGEIISTGMMQEIDLNPVVLYPDGAMILDAKMSVRK